MYTCNSASPKHLSVAIDKFQYVLPYGYLGNKYSDVQLIALTLKLFKF